MGESLYYDGGRILTLHDADGELPTFYLVVGNRTAGKTYYFKRLLLRRFLRGRGKFILLVRWDYEIDGCVESFFKDLLGFEGHAMSQKTMSKGKYAVCYYDDVACGYIIPINSADFVKKHSALFSDASAFFFDEFQEEFGKYIPDELNKFKSIIISVSRGDKENKGKHTRYVPVYMCSNAVSVLNPYYYAFGINGRLDMRTKFLRGPGWVFEHTFNSAAAKEIKKTGVYKAFSGDTHMQYTTGDRYLVDADTFVQKIGGMKSYLCTISMGKAMYGVWQCNDGIVYICKKYDPNYSVIYALDQTSHNEGTIMGKRMQGMLRDCYNAGLVRFGDGYARNVFFAAMGVGWDKIRI